jgi:hypothetical protein
MRIRAIEIATLAAALAMSGGAVAQSDPLASVAGGADIVGQGLGEAAAAGPSVFVTATGHAPIAPASLAAVRLAVNRRNASALAAVRDRDSAVEAITAEARRLGLQAMLGKETLNRTASAMSHPAMGAPPPLATPPPGGVRPGPVAREYMASAEVDVRAGEAAKAAELLDALQAAGVEVDLQSGPAPAPLALPGFSAAGGPAADPAVLDRAADAAMAEARRQAVRLAADAGRLLGEVRQIILLARSASGSEATATVAVRFALGASR